MNYLNYFIRIFRSIIKVKILKRLDLIGGYKFENMDLYCFIVGEDEKNVLYYKCDKILEKVEVIRRFNFFV